MTKHFSHHSSCPIISFMALLHILVDLGLRLFKRTWSIMAKALADEGYAERVTVRQAVKKVAWARN